MAITPITASLIIDTQATADSTVNTWLGTLTITTVYGFSVAVISNTQCRVTILYA